MGCGVEPGDKRGDTLQIGFPFGDQGSGRGCKSNGRGLALPMAQSSGGTETSGRAARRRPPGQAAPGAHQAFEVVAAVPYRRQAAPERKEAAQRKARRGIAGSRKQNSCLLLIAYCLLPIAYCLLPIAYCFLNPVLFGFVEIGEPVEGHREGRQDIHQVGGDALHIAKKQGPWHPESGRGV